MSRISQTAGHGDFAPAYEPLFLLGGQPSHFEEIGIFAVVNGVPEVLAAREQLKKGASQIEIAATGGVISYCDPVDTVQFTPAQMRAAVQAASNWGTDVAAHDYTSADIRRVLEAGVKSIEHGYLAHDATVRLIGEKGAWLSTRPFEPGDEPLSPESAGKTKGMVGTWEKILGWAKQSGVKVAFGTDLLFHPGDANLRHTMLTRLAKVWSRGDLRQHWSRTMHRHRTALRPAAMALASLGMAIGGASPTRAASTSVTPATLPPIATIDERFQSYNVEMAEVIGGNFWKPYDTLGKAAQHATSAPAASMSGSAGLQAGQNATMFQARPPIGLSNARLRRLAAALGPAYMRVSGTWANTVYFQDSDVPAPATAPQGFQGVLTRPQWQGVIEFARAVNAQIVTSFAISAGVRDASGLWTPDQARKLLAYTKSIGGDIAAAEFFNEPTMPEYGGAPGGYDAADYARDFAVFRSFAEASAPGMRIAGPATVGEAVLLPAMQPGTVSVLRTPDLLSANPRPISDVFSYHFYGAASIRCASMGAGAQTTAEAALSEEWLARADRSYAFYGGLRDRFQPGKPIWITEIADAACGGNPWAATFLDSFRYLDQHGRLARQGVKVLFHNTLAASEYGLLDQDSFMPRPNYWAALLWYRLMGSTVLDVGPSRPGLHLYAHCLRGQPGGVALLAINTSRTQTESIELPTPVDRYTLASQRLEDTHIQLNGRDLVLGVNDEFPNLSGSHIPAGTVDLAPATITFLATADAGNGSCR